MSHSLPIWNVSLWYNTPISISGNDLRTLLMPPRRAMHKRQNVDPAKAFPCSQGFGLLLHVAGVTGVARDWSTLSLLHEMSLCSIHSANVCLCKWEGGYDTKDTPCPVVHRWSSVLAFHSFWDSQDLLAILSLGCCGLRSWSFLCAYSHKYIK